MPELQLEDIRLIKNYLNEFVLHIMEQPHIKVYLRGLILCDHKVYIRGVNELVEKLDGILDEEKKYFGATINEPTKDHIKRSLSSIRDIENADDRIEVTSNYLRYTIQKLHDCLTREVNSLAWDDMKKGYE